MEHLRRSAYKKRVPKNANYPCCHVGIMLEQHTSCLSRLHMELDHGLHKSNFEKTRMAVVATQVVQWWEEIAFNLISCLL